MSAEQPQATYGQLGAGALTPGPRGLLRATWSMRLITTFSRQRRHSGGRRTASTTARRCSSDGPAE